MDILLDSIYVNSVFLLFLQISIDIDRCFSHKARTSYKTLILVYFFTSFSHLDYTKPTTVWESLDNWEGKGCQLHGNFCFKYRGIMFSLLIIFPHGQRDLSDLNLGNIEKKSPPDRSLYCTTKTLDCCRTIVHFPPVTFIIQFESLDRCVT